MLLRISHETRLKYSRPVAETIFEVRMGPQSDDDQTVLGYRLRVAPRGAVTAYRDGYGNRVDLFNIITPYQELVVAATSFVRTHRRLSAARLAGVAWPGESPPSVDALEFLNASPLVGPCEELDAFVAGLPPRKGTLADVCRMLIDRVRDRLAYEKRITGVHTHVAEALRLGRGVCQDFTHLFVGSCRAVGLPARYVSGYIHQPGELATHAWAQVWAGSAVGWVDVDPTHGYFPEDDHVVTAVGRDYRDVPPNRGFYRGKSEEAISVTVKVESVDRMPPQWQEWGPPIASVSGPADLREGPSSRRPQRRTMPDQPPMPPGVRHQQGQQQQAGPAAATDPPRRFAEVARTTRETDIRLALDLDGTGRASLATGVGFLDHMLELFAKHGLLDLSVTCQGDLHVDAHHTTEDVGLCLGQAIDRALGDRAGIRRYGHAILPMDDALATCAVDLGGRAYFAWSAPMPSAKIGEFDSELVAEFWRAVATAGRMNLHVLLHSATNTHHAAEAIFKGLARALRAASEPDPRAAGSIPSTKGRL